MKLNGDAVLLAGASGRAGGETLTALLEAGARVVLVGRTQEKLDAAVAEHAPEDARDRVSCFTADIGCANDGEAAVEEVVRRHGRIDAVINLAGRGKFMPIAGSTLDDFMLNIDGFLVSNYNLMLPALKRMLAQPVLEGRRSRGRLVAVTAGSSIAPQPEFGLFGAAKAGVNTFMKAVAREHKADGIVSNAVVLGGVATEEARGYMSPEDFQAAVDPEELGEVLAFLASDASSGINGALVEVNAREVD